jgi:hypothetical protein
MAIQDDFSIDASKNIRQDVAFVPGTHTRYSTLDLHAWLQDLADDASYAGDDVLDILKESPSELAGKRNAVRPMAMTLLNAFNIDDATAQWFKFGSIEQSGGDVLYTGLKVLGSLVASSPIYIYQNGAKITKYWADADSSNFQILVKAKASSADTTLKNIVVYSRKYGQTYSHFDVDLSPGGEQVAALSTAVDANVSLTAGQAETVFGTLTIGYAGYTWDSGDVNGVQNYDAKITLNGTTTLAQAYQALQWATSESSTATINGVPGWRYRTLDAAYGENLAAPVGTYAGGKWFLARGWLIDGVMSAESKSFELISVEGNTVTPPTSVSVSVGNLVAGDYVLVARDNGSGGILSNEYTVSGSSGAGTVTVTGLKSDTPASGVIRIGGDRYEYASWTGTTVTLSGTLSKTYTSADAFIPMIDDTASGATLTSAQMTFDTGFTARYRVRNGGGSPIVPFESTFSVTSTGGSGSVVRTADA